MTFVPFFIYENFKREETLFKITDFKVFYQTVFKSKDLLYILFGQQLSSYFFNDLMGRNNCAPVFLPLGFQNFELRINNFKLPAPIFAHIFAPINPPFHWPISCPSPSLKVLFQS